MGKRILLILFFVLIFSSAGIYAVGNETLNQTIVDNSTAIQNATISNIILTNFMPKEVQLGDVQFNIQVQNNKNETISNTFAFVTGNGFSTYNVVPIVSLASGQKDYIFVYGNLKQAGNINLTIKINDETFYQNITVINQNTESDQQKLDDLKKAQEKEQEIKNISDQLSVIKQNFTILQNEFSKKSSDNYDVSLVNLNTLDNYLHNIQADILTGNVDDAKVNLNLAGEEYLAQKNKLDNAVKLPLINIIKNNVVLFSTFAGAILTFFALYELFKKKKEDISEISKKIVKKEK
ncbi:Uncharacterised protein [uncultured archaeon]|nr:Uncharacterised protein [uncultured archaeon]